MLEGHDVARLRCEFATDPAAILPPERSVRHLCSWGMIEVDYPPV